MEKISSRNNEKIKMAVKVRTSSACRDENSVYFLEGARLCADVSEYVDITEAFFTEAALKKYSAEADKVIKTAGKSYLITEEVAEKLSDTKGPQGIFCICKKSCDDTKVESGKKYIALENVQNPSNVGAIARTAEAMGIDGLIINSGCDIYNPKTLRAAMGSLQRLTVIETKDIAKLIADAKNNGIKTVAAVLDTDNSNMGVLKAESIICIVGNEGNGITDETAEIADEKLKIPMKGRTESLNVATAAAILMWEMINLQD